MKDGTLQTGIIRVQSLFHLFKVIQKIYKNSLIDFQVCNKRLYFILEKDKM